MSSGASPKAIRRAEQLRKELHEHDYKYYVLARPTISDEGYDKLMRAHPMEKE